MKADSAEKNKGISSERLNFILAICAIMISGASFYATYLQANSAEKQVKAMTLPLIQFSHGNYDSEKNLKAINFNIKNAGVGPAIIKDISFIYKNTGYKSLNSFYNACCETEFKSFLNKQRSEFSDKSMAKIGGWVSEQLLNVIIPGQSNYNFQTIYDGTLTHDFWKKLNDERYFLKLKICYCSLLDECFITEKNGVVEQVDVCPVQSH